MLQDIHSHTYYSYCGKDSPEEIIKNAIASGLDLVGICDHYYGIVMAKPGFVYADHNERVTLHTNALTRYYEHIKALAHKYRDYIDVWCGVELTTLDYGYTMLPDGVDVSFFDYCLIEYFQMPETVVEDVFEYAARCKCKRTGLAHADLPAYILSKGYDMDEFFRRMHDDGIFWEMNVNLDSIHKYREHQYVKDFFENKAISDMVKKHGVTLSVGFDGHRVEEYDANRVISACRRLEEMSVDMIK